MLGVFLAAISCCSSSWNSVWCPCTSSSPSGAGRGGLLGVQVPGVHFIGSVVMFWHPGPLLLAPREFNAYTFAIPELLRTASPRTPMVDFWAFFWLRREGPMCRCIPASRRIPRRPRRLGGPGQRPAEMGTYGFLRFSLPLLPDAAKDPLVVNAMGLLSIVPSFTARWSA